MSGNNRGIGGGSGEPRRKPEKLRVKDPDSDTSYEDSDGQDEEGRLVRREERAELVELVHEDDFLGEKKPKHSCLQLPLQGIYNLATCFVTIGVTNELISPLRLPTPVSNLITFGAGAMQYTMSGWQVRFESRLLDPMGWRDGMGMLGGLVAASSVAGIGSALGYGELLLANTTFPLFNATTADKIELGLKAMSVLPEFKLPITAMLVVPACFLLNFVGSKIGDRLTSYFCPAKQGSLELLDEEETRKQVFLSFTKQAMHALLVLNAGETIEWYLRNMGQEQTANSPLVFLAVLFGSDLLFNAVHHLAFHPEPIRSLYEREQSYVFIEDGEIINDDNSDEDDRLCSQIRGPMPKSLKVTLLLTGFKIVNYGMAIVACAVPAFNYMAHNQSDLATDVSIPSNASMHYPVGPFCSQESLSSRLATAAMPVAISALGGFALNNGSKIYQAGKSFIGLMFNRCRQESKYNALADEPDQVVIYHQHNRR